MEELLAAAGMIPDQHPAIILASLLARQDPDEGAPLQSSIDTAALWKLAGWSLKEHTAAALKLAKLRRADPLVATVEALSAQIDQLPTLGPTQQAAFSQEVCQLYQTQFSATNELKTIDCFEKETANATGFEDIDPEDNPWIRISSMGKKAEDVALRAQQQAALVLSEHFADLNATVQGQLSFCSGSAIGRVLQRLGPEKLEDRAAHKQVHMQLQVCLKLASRDQRFSGNVSGGTRFRLR